MSDPAPRRPKLGLALGSGVARGWAHLGVLRALERYGFRPDVVAGTSIGAMVGGSYLAGCPISISGSGPPA
jgi:NTE family protein